MSKRKTVGERIASAMEAGHAISGAHVEDTARAIDRAVRRAQAEAFDEGFTTGNNYAFDLKISDENPYRGRAKR